MADDIKDDRSEPHHVPMQEEHKHDAQKHDAKVHDVQKHDAKMHDAKINDAQKHDAKMHEPQKEYHKSNIFLELYHNHYKNLMIFSVLLLVLSIGVIGYRYYTTGDFVSKA